MRRNDHHPETGEPEADTPDHPEGNEAEKQPRWVAISLAVLRNSGMTFAAEVREALPRLGQPGSRSAELHVDATDTEETLNTAADAEDSAQRPIGSSAGAVATRYAARSRFSFSQLRWFGTTGSLLAALGALGAGALPVVGNPFRGFPGGETFSLLFVPASVVTLVGVAMLVIAWLLMAPAVGAPLSLRRHRRAYEAKNFRHVDTREIWRTFAAWAVPLLFTAPLFTQDIYSYLAQGSIVRQGLDVYSAGPIDLLPSDDPLARSVPYVWAHSPSPYGPVALGFAAAISAITNDSMLLGIVGHRIIGLIGVIAAGWAVHAIAKRCGVPGRSALWLGILNPLTLLHLIAGIHNESLMLGFVMVGLEVGLRGIDAVKKLPRTPAMTRARKWWKPALLLVSSAALISCGGMVKVTGFLALGFIGMALARELHRRGHGTVMAIAVAAGVHLIVLIATIAVITAITGIGLGWITGQGGATRLRSWMSLTTAVGVTASSIGSLLGLGDHSDAVLSVTHLVGVLVAAVFVVRMLWATFRGRIHPVGALGVSMLVTVILFPVVHPWYLLWAIFPLVAWANRLFFHIAVVAVSVILSFLVLPRGLALAPGTVAGIYLWFAVALAVVLGVAWCWVRYRPGSRLGSKV